MDFFRKQNWDIVGKAGLWLGTSAVLIVFGMVWWATHGLNLGIDFTGGTLLRYQMALPLSGERAEERQVLRTVRGILDAGSLGSSPVQIAGNNQIYIRVPSVSEADADTSAASLALEQKLLTDLNAKLAADHGEITMVSREKVGPIVGDQLRNSALYALLIGSLLILIYITIRYEFRFAVAAIISLVHDVLIVLGAMAVLQIELDSAFVAALLTVIGYSINDTVIIFDRIRENRRLQRGASFQDAANASLLQTMTRSINTTFTTLLALIAIAGWGGMTIRGFAIALIIGITCGAYSSIFTATPILVLWYRATGDKRRVVARSSNGRSLASSRTRSRIEETTTTDDDAPEQEAATTGTSAVDSMRRAAAQELEEKRAERKERRKSKGSKRRRF